MKPRNDREALGKKWWWDVDGLGVEDRCLEMVGRKLLKNRGWQTVVHRPTACSCKVGWKHNDVIHGHIVYGWSMRWGQN